MRPAPAVACLALLLAAGAAPARAQEAPSVTASATPPEPLAPGGDGEGSLAVSYCYASAPASAATVTVGTISAPAWLNASYQPASFRATTGGGSTCGSANVAIQLRASRAAPAFAPEILKMSVVAQGAASQQESDPEVAVQADYRSSLRAPAPSPLRATRGDSATLQLGVGVAANGGTRLEIVGFDPGNKLNAQGVSQDTAAGAGLDTYDTQTYRVPISVSPGAMLGPHPLQLNLTTKYVKSPSILGDAKTLRVEVDVVEASTPAPSAAIGALAAAGAAVLLARRRA